MQNLSSAAVVNGALRVKVINDIILSMAFVNIKENCRYFRCLKIYYRDHACFFMHLHFPVN